MIMSRNIAILGSTGSIGVQSLNVCEKRSYNITALSANTDYKKLEAQIRRYKPRIAALADERAASELKIRAADTSVKILAGTEGVCECASEAGADTVINAVVGLAGLLPALAALNAEKRLALANKESLVAGGNLVKSAAKRNNSEIIPVDSEHSAIFQCLNASPPNKALRRIILTASGGPFFGKTRDELRGVTVADALKHPNWSMGAKITVDSATMFNKGLELIEAYHLFGLAAENIDIVVHRESIVHSMIEFDDCSVIAQLGQPDMRIPIQYALTYPERYTSPVSPLDFSQIGKLTFYKPDCEVFDCLGICREAIERGGLYPAAVNSANEEANRLFCEGSIPFLEIGRLIRTAFELSGYKDEYTLDDVFAIDREAREAVLSSIKNLR